VAGAHLELTAASGSIGAQGERLVTDATGVLTASAATGIYLEERSGDLVSDNLASAAGSIDLLVANGRAYLANVSAPDEVVILVQGSLLDVADIESARLSLGVAGEGGSIEVGAARVSDDVQARADHINLPSVAHTTGATPLHLDVAGNDGGLASSIAIRTGSSNSVVFDNYRSDTGNVVADTESLEFKDAVVGTSATFANRVLRVQLDYKDAKLNESSEPHDTGNLPFYMIFTGTKLATNANPDMFVDREQVEEETP
jgi:hypothetical protein